MRLDRVTFNSKQMNGQPCIRNLRLTVKRVIELLATYPDRTELFQEFPELQEEDIQQALIFALSQIICCIFSTVSGLNNGSPVSWQILAGTFSKI